MQDLNDKSDGNTLGAAEWNQLPSEVQNVIENLGQTLSGADVNQLGKGIAGYVVGGQFMTDSGAADAYVLSKIGSKQGPTAYANGFTVYAIPANNNTGIACTININSIGAASVKDEAGADPAADTIVAGLLSKFRYDGANFVHTQYEQPELVDEVVVSGGAVTQIDFTGLNINTHKGYRVEIDLVNAAVGAFTLSLFINGDTTSTNYYTQVSASAGATHSDARTNDSVLYSATNIDQKAMFSLSLLNGYPTWSGINTADQSATINVSNYGGIKTATVANITQLTFTASVASALANGTRIRIYRENV
jgi:hypothetical protein